VGSVISDREARRGAAPEMAWRIASGSIDIHDSSNKAEAVGTMTFTKAYGVGNTEGEVLNMLGTVIRVLAGRRTGSSFSLMAIRLPPVKGLRRISMMTKMRPFTSSRVICASRPALTNGCFVPRARWHLHTRSHDHERGGRHRISEGFGEHTDSGGVLIRDHGARRCETNVESPLRLSTTAGRALCGLLSEAPDTWTAEGRGKTRTNLIPSLSTPLGLPRPTHVESFRFASPPLPSLSIPVSAPVAGQVSSWRPA
jgi:hypothetical protein